MAAHRPSVASTGPLELVGACPTATDRIMSLPWKVLSVFSKAVLLRPVLPLLHNESHHSTAAL